MAIVGRLNEEAVRTTQSDDDVDASVVCIVRLVAVVVDAEEHII